jgi:hypothetical protein
LSFSRLSRVDYVMLCSASGERLLLGRMFAAMRRASSRPR